MSTALTAAKRDDAIRQVHEKYSRILQAARKDYDRRRVGRTELHVAMLEVNGQGAAAAISGQSVARSHRRVEVMPDREARSPPAVPERASGALGSGPNPSGTINGRDQS